MQQEKLIDFHETINETIQKDATMRQIEKTVLAHPIHPMMAPTVEEITSQSIYYDPTSTTAEVYNHWNMDTSYWINGAVKIDAYSLHFGAQVMTPAVYTQAIKEVLFRHLANDLTKASAHTPEYPRWYTLQAFYLGEDEKPQERTLNIWAGIPTSKQDITLDHISEDFVTTLSNTNYEGKTKHGNFNLDYSRFNIVTIDITKTAGNEDDMLEVNDWMARNKQGTLHMSWGTIEMNSTPQNECFLKVLSEHLKSLGIAKGRRYTFLTNEGLGLTRNNATSTQAAITACDILNIKLFIHNIDGEIIHEGVGESQARNPFPAISRLQIQTDLHVLMYDNHYMRIVGDVKSPLKLVKKAKRDPLEKNYRWKYSRCYFDLETVTNKVQAIPYSISYAINDGPIKFQATPEPSIAMFDHMMNDLRQQGPGKHHTCIAYNGSNFDFVPFYRYLLEKGYYCVKEANPSGKGQSFTFSIGTNKSEEWIAAQPAAEQAFLRKQYSLLTVWDPVLFVNKSLAVAARDFGLSVSKGDIDHDEVQQDYQKGMLGKWLDKNQDKLKEYNDKDVEVLRELTKKLLSELVVITGFTVGEIMNTPSISALAYKLFNHLVDTAADKTFMPRKTWSAKTLYKQQKENRYNYPRPRRVREEAIDKLIRKSATAGRVQGEVGYRKMLSVIVDVVSLYPTAMLKNLFPVGPEKVWLRKDFASFKEMTELLRELINSDHQCAMIRVAYDQSKMTTPHPVLPVRIEGKPLDWHTFSSGEELLPLVTIRQLKKYGARLSFKHAAPDTVMAIEWAEAPCFEEYINMLSELKNDQDKLKEAGDPRYNPTLREMVKMLLNGLSGKMIQKNYENKYKLVGDKNFHDKCLRVIRKAALEGETEKETINRIQLGVQKVTTHHYYLTWKGSGWKADSKASHVGVFIYAYARAYMFEHVMSKMQVWYTDTDSALIALEDFAKIDPSLLCVTVDPVTMRVTQTREKQFGDFEVEKVCDSFIVVSPKTYCLINDGKVVKNGIKGVRKTDQFLANDVDMKLVGENLLELYELLLKNKEVKMETGADPKVEITAFQVRRSWKTANLHYLQVKKYI